MLLCSIAVAIADDTAMAAAAQRSAFEATGRLLAADVRIEIGAAPVRSTTDVERGLEVRAAPSFGLQARVHAIFEIGRLDEVHKANGATETNDERRARNALAVMFAVLPGQALSDLSVRIGGELRADLSRIGALDNHPSMRRLWIADTRRFGGGDGNADGAVPLIVEISYLLTGSVASPERWTLPVPEVLPEDGARVRLQLQLAAGLHYGGDGFPRWHRTESGASPEGHGAATGADDGDPNVWATETPAVPGFIRAVVTESPPSRLRRAASAETVVVAAAVLVVIGLTVAIRRRQSGAPHRRQHRDPPK